MALSIYGLYSGMEKKKKLRLTKHFLFGIPCFVSAVDARARLAAYCCHTRRGSGWRGSNGIILLLLLCWDCLTPDNEREALICC